MKRLERLCLMQLPDCSHVWANDVAEDYRDNTDTKKKEQQPSKQMSVRKVNRRDVTVGEVHTRGGRRTCIIFSLPFLSSWLAFAHCGGWPQTHAGINLHLVHIFEVVFATTWGKKHFIFNYWKLRIWYERKKICSALCYYRNSQYTLEHGAATDASTAIQLA